MTTFNFRKYFPFVAIIVLASVVVFFALAQNLRSAEYDDSGGKGLGNIDPYSGSFSTNFPIAVPPYHGLEPKLSLAYDSGGGNGWVGMGWNLTGYRSSSAHRRDVACRSMMPTIFSCWMASS